MIRNILKSLTAILMVAPFAAGMALAEPGNKAGNIGPNSSVSENATVSMNVALYAAIKDLDDFSLQTSDADGSAGAIYSGSDAFSVQSNGQVRVTLAGADLVSGANVITPDYALDSSGLTFDTGLGVHNQVHSISASAQLGEISDLEAGAYSGEITMTVSAL